MAKSNKYTIIANITEAENGGIFHLTGAGRYAYAKDEKTKWLLLEGKTAETTKLVEKTEIVVGVNDNALSIILATAMINKKALKLTVEESKNGNEISYALISIQNP